MSSILSRLLTGDTPWLLTYPDQNNVCQSTARCGVKTRQARKKNLEETVRFGRVPKREKAKILAAMQKVNASSHEKALTAELEDELKLLTTIIRAHEETCDYTKEKVAPLIERARTQPVYTQCPPQLACPLNPASHSLENGGSTRIMEDFSERFSPAIRGVVEFAKRIPGFSLLAQDDQVTLLKAGVFEVLLVRLACMFDSQANSLICLNGQVLRRESLHSASNARFLLDSMFDFAERLNSLHLSDSDVGLFCAVVVIAADRPGLRNMELVQKIQKKIMEVLQKSVTSNHPENPAIFAELIKKIPDLRTLNTLHSEKLLAYKMEPRNHPQAMETASAISTSTNSSIYPGITPDIWCQYSMLSAQQRPLNGEEDNRSTSPGQQSQHSGSTTGSEWSTTDSKDGHELIGSPHSIGSGISAEDIKSPIRSSSFSSTRSYESECVWVGENMHGPEFQNLAKRATREPNGSEHGNSSGDESYFNDSPVKGTTYPKIRRVDSPTDSGIESGKEHGSSTTPTISICSSPRSTMEEKVKDIILEPDPSDKHECIEDMPVLKRALQAPPLVNTNMLMDEAYRHHKKFRAARRDVESPSSPSGLSLASSHSTLVKTLEQAPRYLSEQQLKRTDLIHNIIMRTEAVPGNQQPQTEMQETNGGSSVPLSVNNNYAYSVPTINNTSPVPPTLVPSPNQNSKSVVVCPQGYYIPHNNVQVPNYTSNSVSWPFVAPQASMANTVTMANSTVQVRTQFPNDHQSNVQLMTAPPQQAVSPVSVPQAPSPRLIYNPRSPSSPLVITNGLSSPTIHGGHLETHLPSMASPKQEVSFHGDHMESQPLNLSKKPMSPPTLKMES